MTDTIARNNKLMAGRKYLNKKTGNIYRVIGVAQDATNIREGNAVVIYERYSADYSTELFVRDLDEFKVKFTRCC